MLLWTGFLSIGGGVCYLALWDLSSAPETPWPLRLMLEVCRCGAVVHYTFSSPVKGPILFFAFIFSCPSSSFYRRVNSFCYCIVHQFIALFPYCSFSPANIMPFKDFVTPEEHCNNHQCKLKCFWPQYESHTFPKMLLMNHIVIFSLCFYTRDNINIPKLSLLHKWASVSCSFFTRQKTSLWKLSPRDKRSLGCKTARKQSRERSEDVDEGPSRSTWAWQPLD